MSRKAWKMAKFYAIMNYVASVHVEIDADDIEAASDIAAEMNPDDFAGDIAELDSELVDVIAA